MSATTSTSKYDGNDVVMFNLADDPYELYNVWDQNKSLGEELAAEIVNAGMSPPFHHLMALESVPQRLT